MGAFDTYVHNMQDPNDDCVAWKPELSQLLVDGSLFGVVLEAYKEAHQRIAELEARDKPKFVQCWSCKHNIEILAIADCDGYCPRCAAPIDLDDEPYIGTAAAGKGE